MPITIKQHLLKVKDGNTYVGIDALAETTTQEHVTAINDAGTAQMAAITAKGVETRATIPDKYTALSDEVQDLKSAIGCSAITGWTIGRYYTTNVTPIATPIDATDNTKTTNNPLNRCISIPCSPGDVFTLNLVGANVARAWCFAKADGTVISVADSNALVNNLVIEAPAESAFLVLNDKRTQSTDPFTNICYYGYYVAEHLNRIDQGVNEAGQLNGQTVSVTFTAASQNQDTEIYLEKGKTYWFRIVSGTVSKPIIVYPVKESTNYVIVDNGLFYSLTPAVGDYLRVFNQANGYIGTVTLGLLSDTAYYNYALRELYDNRYMRVGGQYTTREAWIAAFPTDKLADIPLNRLVCIGSTNVNPSDAPDNFAGNVITLCVHTALQPGAIQMANNLMEDGAIYLRRYVYNSGGNYWNAWIRTQIAEEEYHVGATRDYTSLTTLLLDLAGNQRKKVIYIDGGTYDVFAEYTAEVTAGRITIPPDDVGSGDYFGTYNAFVPNNTRIVGLGDVVLQFTPLASEITYGASRTWSPLNILGSVEIENITIEAHNCRYAMHNDDHNTYPNSKQHYKNVKFHYQKGDTNASNQELGYGICVGFGINKGSTHVYDDCEMTNTGGAGYCVYYGHEAADGNDGALVLRNCRIKTANYNNACTVRLQTLARNTTGKVTALFENCYINGGIELNPYYTDSIQSFVVTLSQTNKVAVSRRNTQGGTIVDPYTLTWVNPLATPTAQAPLIEENTYGE